MTDPQTPANEAEPSTPTGRAMLASIPTQWSWDDPRFIRHMARGILAIEAEARATIPEGEVWAAAHLRGRADALREAAERVRALDAWHDLRTADLLAFRAAVLAILDPQP
jgi:hypothetical protein